MPRRIFLGALAAAVLAAAPVLAETVRFTVIGIDCAACGPPIVKALKGVSGVGDAKVDWKAGVATVEVPEGFDRTKLRDAVAAIGYEAVFDGEARKDLLPLPEEERRGLDIKAATDGARIDLKTVVVPGKVTVLDYWAEWCSPCHLLDARLQHLVKANPDVAVRRVNVGKWDNDAARQATREFRLEALPYVRVYDAKGKFVGAVTGGSWDEILKTIEKARGKA
jgi:thiol-disulfide isomerase/thioredoxin